MNVAKDGALRNAEFAAPPGAPRALDRALKEHFAGASWSVVRRAIETGKISVAGQVVKDARQAVAEGALVRVAMTTPKKKSLLADGAIVFVDGQVVVVRKPAGVSTVPYEEGERDSLDQLVQGELARRFGREAPLGVVQRLDRETSGLVVFARTVPAKRHLKNQFRAHTVSRRYLALAAGRVSTQTIRSRLVRDRGDGVRGSTRNPKLGREAVTHVEALEALAGATLIACRLETGRTHQIRIHLGELGHPLLGERVYGDRDLPRPAAPRLMLHATLLGFVHPGSQRELSFEEPTPADMLAVIERLRG
jgi:23S rRNA pseudouridine1911/1915/1917 synthase